MKALVTGASSGIGEAFAIKFAQLGYDLIITGRREDLLNSLANHIREKYNVSVLPLQVELANNDDLEKLVSIIRQIDKLDVLVNNAGFGSRSLFLDEDYSVLENMIKVHLLASMKLIYAALPGMVRRDTGILINVSSISGKTPLPAGALYSATKSFLQIFSESLYLENSKSNIIIQSLCPGFTKTDFHKRVGIEYESHKNKGIVRWMSPEQVVENSLKNLKKGRVICVPGFWNKVLWILADIIPRRIYYKLVLKVADPHQIFNSDLTTATAGMR